MLQPSLVETAKANPDDNPANTQFESILEPQARIGFHLVPKGFFTIRFRLFVVAKGLQVTTNTHKQAVDFTAGLIQALWTMQMELWKMYQEEQNSTMDSQTRLYEKHQECILRIRLLHEHRHLCLADHRDKFFYPEVEEFLEKATTSQMKSYLQQYEPAIRQSIKQATNITNRPLSAYPGFVPIRRQLMATPAPATKPPHGRGQMHPKHSRWKSGSHTRSICTYFLDQNAPSPEPS